MFKLFGRSHGLGERNEMAVQMLRDMKVPKGTPVWTADNIHLGVASRLFHRQADINAQLKLFATYLEVQNLAFGNPMYIPTDYIQAYDPVSGRLLLSVSLSVVANETWDRTPAFVVGRLPTLHGATAVEELA